MDFKCFLKLALVGTATGIMSSSAFAAWSPKYTQYIEKNIPRTLVSVHPSQVEMLCPKYSRLRTDDKEKFWADLFQAISQAESNHNHTTRFREVGLGRDMVTGSQIFSEGLLQLSYADARVWKCDFDWSRDRRLAAKDARKTIFDPYKQFECAFNIFEGLMVRKGKNLVTSRGHYWSTLMTGRPGYKRLSQALRARVGGYCH